MFCLKEYLVLILLTKNLSLMDLFYMQIQYFYKYLWQVGSTQNYELCQSLKRQIATTGYIRI